MKVVFPCKGSIVLTKSDVAVLEAFYNTKMSTSKMKDFYETSEYMLQVGNFKYLPKNYSIKLYKANLMSIKRMRELLGIPVPEEPPKKPVYKTPIIKQGQSTSEESISDDSLLSHPFFQTLKPVNN